MKPKNIALPFRLLLIIGIIFFLIPACSGQDDDLPCERLIAEVESRSIDSTFRIYAPSHINNFEIVDVFYLAVVNESGSLIEVAPDRDIKVFWWKDNSWQPTKNSLDYLSVVEQLTSKSGDDPGGTAYGISLDVPEQENSIRVCIILEGLKDPDGVQQKVSAYTEVILNP